MIGTHTPKLFNSRVKNLAINADVIADVPAYFICSKTVNIRQKYWALPANAADMKKWREIPQAQRKEAPKSLPDITDSQVKQLLIPLEDTYISVTPVSSCGLLNELSMRLFERSITPVKKWIIEPVPAAYSNHGELALAQNGRLSLLIRGCKNFSKNTKSAKEYVIVRFFASNMNISGGMLAVGFPAITAVGGLIHAIERETRLNIKFAVGYKNMSWTNGAKISAQMKGKKAIPHLHLDEITGSGDVILLMKVKKTENDKLLNYLRANPFHRFSGGSVFDFQVSLGRYDDNYAFVIDASSEVITNDTSDALDFALTKYRGDGYFNEDGDFVRDTTQFVGYTLIQSGYALLENPTAKKLSRNNYPHAWSEPVFTMVDQTFFNNKCFWVKKEKKFGLIWERDYNKSTAE